MLENIRLSFQGVWSHKMRSFLTMLGIIIGIASIIAIVSTIKGTNEQIKQNLVGAGNNTIDIKLMENNYEYYPDNYNIPSSIPILDETLREDLLEIPEVEIFPTIFTGITQTVFTIKIHPTPICRFTALTLII